MKITPIGIDINCDDVINDFYKTYQDRKCVKICKETDFQTGYISYEDGVFLPNGTYVLIKEKGKKDILGKIFHFKKISSTDSSTSGTAIVNIFYDMNSSNEIYNINERLIICFIYKNHLLNHHNKEKYLQVVSCDITEDDKWKFVRVEYGNPDTKMFYMYGWEYYDNNIYENKNTLSNKLSCLNKINKTFFVYEDEYDLSKVTNTEYKIKPHVYFVPYEIEYFIIYIFLLCITLIFKARWLIWTILTICFITIRRKIREKYNG